METTVFSIEGKELRKISLNDSVFGREVSEGSIYHAIRNELANKRMGTAHTKTRAEVHGSNTKPWKQKGTGRARSGDKKSPVWVGGGTMFGPRKRDFSYVIPRKVKKLAFKSILSMKASTERLKVVEDFSIESGKTKDLNRILLNLVGAERTVLVLKNDDKMVKQAGRNIPWLTFLTFNRLRAHDLFYAKNLLVMEGAALGLNDFYDQAVGGEE